MSRTVKIVECRRDPAIIDEQIRNILANDGYKLINYNDEKDGYCKGDWIILNADPIVVHLFTYAERSRYNLDKLYKSKEIDLFKEIKKKKSK